MHLRLDLNRHCIETALKRRHTRAVSDYFGADEATRKDLETVIEMTQQALQNLDFSYLRSTYSQLAGHTDAQVVLLRKAGQVGITIDGSAIETHP